MLKLFKIPLVLNFLIFPICFDVASAICVKPSGNYVGSQAGQAFNNGSLYNYSANIYYFNFNINGSGLGDFVSKDTAAPPPYREYSLSFTWLSGSNLFDTVKCRGTLVLNTSVSNQRKLIYVSHNSGANIDVLWYDDQDLVISSILTLHKQ